MPVQGEDLNRKDETDPKQQEGDVVAEVPATLINASDIHHTARVPLRKSARG